MKHDRKDLESNNNENQSLKKLEEKIEKIYEILEIDKTTIGKVGKITPEKCIKEGDVETDEKKEFLHKADELNIKLDNIIKRCDDVYNRFIDSDRVISDLNGEIYKLKYSMEILQEKHLKQISEVENEKEKCESKAKKLEKEIIENIMQLVTFRDNIIMRGDYAEIEASKDVISVMNSLSKESAMILKKCGVEILEGDGKFDNRIHKATNIVKTEDETLHDMISKTFRPGYTYNGQVLRSQEVILYSYKKKEDIPGGNDK